MFSSLVRIYSSTFSLILICVYVIQNMSRKQNTSKHWWHFILIILTIASVQCLKNILSLNTDLVVLIWGKQNQHDWVDVLLTPGLNIELYSWNSPTTGPDTLTAFTATQLSNSGGWKPAVFGLDTRTGECERIKRPNNLYSSLLIRLNFELSSAGW